MNVRELILKKAVKPDDRLLISKVLDKAEFAARTGKFACTDFLDPHQQSIVDSALSVYGNIQYSYYGGYSTAERAMAIIRPEFSEDEDIDKEFIKKCATFFKMLHIVPASRDNLSHRDYLGSLMALGIKREKTGDILVREEHCDIFVANEIADFIQSNLLKVGNTKVSVTVKEIGEIAVPEQKVREINVTVASLRLDCITGPGFGMSRSKAGEFIKAGRLSLNWELTDNPSRLVKEGDTVSIRGKGKIVVDKIGNRTKKDRIGILLKKYI